MSNHTPAPVQDLKPGDIAWISMLARPLIINRVRVYKTRVRLETSGGNFSYPINHPVHRQA